jgi:hypothetical protein
VPLLVDPESAAVKIVHSFAEALDRDDYESALHLLERDATYQRDTDLIRGASAIVDSFRQVSEWGHRNLDALEFYHEIDDETSPLEICFIDILRSKGDELEVRHSMHLTISKNGLIAHLRLVSPPDEKEILGEFFRRHNVKPPEAKQ